MIDDESPWSAPARARLTEASAALSEALTLHTATLTAFTSDPGHRELFEAGNLLLAALREYADAQFALSWSGFPLGVVHQLDDEDGDGDTGDGTPSASGVSVLTRRDYAVLDESVVIDAGRRAYLDVHPEDDEGAASEDVTHLGRALYQLAHAEGWDGLDEVDGLVPTGGSVIVRTQPSPLNGDPDSWPEDLFEVGGAQLYRQDDIYSG